MNIEDAVIKRAVLIGAKLNAPIVVHSRRGSSALKLSRERILSTIIAITSQMTTARKLICYRNVEVFIYESK